MVWVGAGAVFRASRWLWSTKATRLTEECMNMTAVNHAIAFPVQWRSKKKSVWTNKNQLLTRSLDSDSHLEPFLSFTFSHCLLWFSHTVWFRFKHQNCLAKKKADGLGVKCQKNKKQKTMCLTVSRCIYVKFTKLRCFPVILVAIDAHVVCAYILGSICVQHVWADSIQITDPLFHPHFQSIWDAV